MNLVGERQFEQEVLRSELPVLVDFTADWCQPCKQVKPELEAIARELEGRCKVVQVDIDKSPRLAQLLRIQSVPTFVVFHQGRPAAMEVGVLTRQRLRELVTPFLPRAEGAVPPSELAALVAEGAVVTVDTRDPASFARAHLPGAVNMPLEQIEGRLAELMMMGVTVLYCRSGDRTRELCEKLGRDDVRVAFLEGGILAWEAESRPIERS
jgi:thioredoxin 1/putative thioredoxin